MSEEENIIKYKDAIKAGDNGRRIVWAYVSLPVKSLPPPKLFRILYSNDLVHGSGSGVGLIKSVLSAGEVVVKTQTEAKDILDKLQKNMTFSTHF